MTPSEYCFNKQRNTNVKIKIIFINSNCNLPILHIMVAINATKMRLPVRTTSMPPIYPTNVSYNTDTIFL